MNKPFEYTLRELEVVLSTFVQFINPSMSGLRNWASLKANLRSIVKTLSNAVHLDIELLKKNRRTHA